MREFIFLFLFYGIIESSVLNNAKVKSDKDEGKSSLAFVFDTTGSMSNDLKQLREGAGMILKTALEESNIIADFVFVPFHDPTIGPATITKSKEVFKNALNIVNVMGGGDCPEKSLGGVLLALSVSRPRSYVYVFTDASASDYNLVGKVLDVVQRKQSQVVFVLTGHCNDLKRQTYKVYQQVATASSGQVFNLNKTNVHNVLDFLRSSIQGRSVNLASAVHPAGYNYTQAIPVDSSLGEVTVSVSGAKPTIKVVNPSGQEVVGPPQLVTTLDLSEIMIVKVLQPEPGNWTITVGSEKDYSVKVSGLSNVTFDHGFSVEKTNSMDEASYRPLQGTYNHMLLSMTPEVSIQIDYAEILTTDGKTLFEVPVKQLEKNTFLADAFIPPDDLFYIAINGRDQNGQKFRRVGPTAVQAKPPDVPYITALKKIEARSHDRVVLKCNVESLVPVTVQWTRASPTMQRKISSLQSTSIEYVIEDMSEADVGSYRCSASNAAGHSKINTQLSLIVEPPQVSVLPVNATLSSGEDLTVSCAVFSEAMLLKSQIIFNNGNKVNVTNIKVGRNIDGFYSYNKTISNVTEKHRGTYTCLAVNRGGTTNQSTYIFIESEPTAKIFGPDIIAGQLNTKLQLLCQVENANLAQWMSPNGTVAKEVAVNGTSNMTLDVTVTEEGYWTCIGLRNSHRASDIVQVNIEIKPEVVIEVRNITIVEGSIQQLVCTARAKPPPSLTWRRETHDYNTTVVQVNETAYRSVLTLDSDRNTVNGTYSCIAENSLGTAQDSVVVNVRRKMQLLQSFTDQQVELYSQVDLHCNVDTHPPATITWQHNHTDVQTDDNTDISDDGTILCIQKVDFNDLGLYTCRMDNGYESIQVNGTLNVVGLESPVLSKEPSRITARRGDTALISCRLLNGNPEPKIRWQYKSNGTEEFKHLKNKVKLNEDGFVVAIHNVSLHDEGFYQCIAENAIGKDNYQVFLDIQYPPELKKSGPQSVLEIKSGDKVVLNCNAVGNPSPIVVWTKGKPVSYSKNVYLSDTNELVISNVSLYHSGTYSCNASSALGSVTTNYTLQVYMSPTISTQTPEQAIQLLEGQLVELPCAMSGSPTPTVTWLHNDKNVTERRKYIDEYGLRFVANLTDFGDYSCIATNAYGKAVLNYTVYVWVAPFLEPPLLETKNVLLGSNITLQCNAIGFPVPIIMWQFNNSLLAENSTDLSFNEFGQLNISNASNKNEGHYECVAENLAGITAKTITVNINEPPKILEDNYTGPYVATVLDTSLAVACKAAGKPAPYVVWIKDGYYLDRDFRYDIDMEGTLTIKSPSEDLSGDYTCLAKNSIGTATRTVPVQIYSVPSMMVSEESQSVVHVVEGSNATVDCPLRRGLNDTLKWYKDAELISNKSLHLTPVTRAHAATYACVVSNIAGGAHAALTVDVQWPPHIQTTTQLVETVKGNDVNLNCDVDAKPRAKTRWLFNSNLLLGEDKSHLKLTNIQLRQTGVYKCIAANEHGTVVKEFTVDVLVPPFISDFDVLDVQLKEGTNATLECNARGYPKPHIKWTFINTSWVINNSTISANITTDSEGIYKCEASNKAGTTSLVYRVNVVKVASIENIVAFNDTVGTNVVQRLEVILGSYIRIACKGSGKPVPNIQWIRYGNTVSNNTPSISYADLIINKVATSDSGFYVCVASNEGGVDERKIKLDVLEPPKIFQNLFQEESSINIINLEVLSGQAFYMHCHPNGNPLPDIYWFKDNIPLKLFDDTMMSTDYSEIIQSPNAKYEQTGNYTCIAKNKVGETGLVYLVDVLVPPPQPKESIKEVRTRISKALNLTCPAEGVPKPHVTWIKHPYMEISEHVPRVQLTDDNVTLIINDTLVTDSGLYSCVITNKVGAIEVNFNVIIEKPSSIVGNEGNDTVENHVVSLRRSVVLKCDVDGHPPPKITWLKDMQRVSEGGGGGVQVQAGVGSRLLAVWGAEERHAGQYICMAENSAGIASRRYNLAVKVPGKWSAWSQWSYCNVTCGLGYQKRSRFCHYIDDKNNTIDKTSMSDKIILDESACKGSTIDKRKCHMPSCEEEASGWSGWSRWGACSATCGVGTQARARRCRARARNECSGDNMQIRKCPNLPKCSPQSRHPTNEVYSSQESEIDMYLPETTIEMQPDDEFKRTLYPEEVYVPTGKKPQMYFDVKVTDNLDRSERGPCDAGFRYNATDGTCEDVDECSYDINQCHLTQVCTNTAGGYRCSCPAGYVALAAGLRCLDVNECEQEVHGCEFACVNVAGGYVCACPRHLRLHVDRHHCVLPPLYKKPLSFDENSVSDEYLTDEDVPARYTKYTRY